MKDDLQGLIGNNLKKYRIAQKLTRESVAKKVGISLTYYANLESGNRIMSVPILRKLADVLCTSTDALLYEEEQDSQIKNMELLLKSQSQETVVLAEKVVRLLVNELSESSDAGAPGRSENDCGGKPRNNPPVQKHVQPSDPKGDKSI